MAGPSPSPSGSSRRLSELLEEQQEPFSLHLYLLEKGCSPTTLDAAGGCGAASLPCWPRSRGTSPAPRRVTASKRTPATASGLLSKLLHGTVAPASTKRRRKLRSAAIGPCSVEGEKAASKRKNAVEARRAEAEDDEGGSYDDDDDSSKQLSPVSVLERRAFEKPPRAYAVAEKAMVVLRELLDAARKPALLQRKVAIESCKSGDVLMETSTTTTTTPAPPPAPAPTRTDRATSVAHLEMFEARGHDLVPLDMPGERGDARLGRWDVGAELAVAVLEALTEEVVVELMGMVHHEDASAMDGKQCWLLPNC